MVLKWRSQRWFSAAVFVLGVIALVVVAYAFLLLRTNFATAGFSLLIVVVLISTLGSYVSSVLLAVVAMACLAYFFA